MVPRLVAHRGWARRWPENTVESLMAAVDAGADHVEFDVQLSADGVPILLHDATLERTAGRPGCAMDMNWEELQHISVGETARLGDACPGARLPSLSLICEWLATEPGVTAFVEIKTESLSRFGVERVLEPCLDLLSPILERCVVTSFSHEVLLEASHRPEVIIAWVLESWGPESLARAETLAPEYVFCNHRKLPEGLTSLPKSGWHWVLYEVADADLAMELAARGAGYIETMAIGDLLKDPRFSPGSAPC
ncbi:MAG: glycerophosphodiester phosphodiesterase family protein [Gammaproteobacteria bacterium]|jgi:glycerophosphoryl diester phosphodiesterase